MSSFVALGDSIVRDGAPLFDEIQRRLGYSSYRNYGVSGRPMADGTANGAGTVTTSDHVYFSADDMVYIAAGTNDFKLSVPIGDIGSIHDTSFDRTTFLGAYRDTIRHVLASNPSIDIFLATPLHRDNRGYDSETRNPAGHLLSDYREAIFQVAEMYAVPVVDMYANSGINSMNLSVMTKDGLHPNKAGYARMAKYAVGTIRAHGGGTLMC